VRVAPDLTTIAGGNFEQNDVGLSYAVGVRILVVEDQDSIRRMIEALVQARGYSVTAVGTGSKALDIALTDPPDLILLDLMLRDNSTDSKCARESEAKPRRH